MSALSDSVLDVQDTLYNQKIYHKIYFTLPQAIPLVFHDKVIYFHERAVRNILSKSNLCENREEGLDHVIKHVRHLINPELTGEAILTTGAVTNEVVDNYCGVISIGPFGCMPTRVAEAVLTGEMNMVRKSS